jgi:DNA-binding NarL/FixJ family response regulator
MVILDLNFDSSHSPALIRALKDALGPRPVQIVAYVSHVQTDPTEEARKNGADLVIPRSVFSNKVPEPLQGRHVDSL